MNTTINKLLIVSSLILSGCTTNVSITERPEVSASPTPTSYTLEEVAAHNTPEDCWLVISGNVYNVSGFAERHPGGEAVYLGCGKDATMLFENRPGDKGPHPSGARALLPNFQIGTLRE